MGRDFLNSSFDRSCSEECGFEAYRSVVNSGIEFPRIVHLEYKEDRQYTYKITLRARSCIHFCSGKTSITYFEYMFVTIGIQHAMRIRHVIICGLPCCTIFFHLPQKPHDFRKKCIVYDWGFSVLCPQLLGYTSQRWGTVRTLLS